MPHGSAVRNVSDIDKPLSRRCGGRITINAFRFVLSQTAGFVSAKVVAARDCGFCGFMAVAVAVAAV